MPDISSRIDAVQGTKFTSVFDVQAAYNQTPHGPATYPETRIPCYEKGNAA